MFAYPLYQAPGTLMQMLQSRKTRLDDSDRPVNCRFFKPLDETMLAKIAETGETGDTYRHIGVREAE